VDSTRKEPKPAKETEATALDKSASLQGLAIKQQWCPTLEISRTGTVSAALTC